MNYLAISLENYSKFEKLKINSSDASVVPEASPVYEGDETLVRPSITIGQLSRDPLNWFKSTWPIHSYAFIKHYFIDRYTYAKYIRQTYFFKRWILHKKLNFVRKEYSRFILFYYKIVVDCLNKCFEQGIPP